MKTLFVKTIILSGIIFWSLLAQAQGPGDGTMPNTKPGNRTNDGTQGVPVDSSRLPGNKGATGTRGGSGSKGASGATNSIAPTVPNRLRGSTGYTGIPKL